MRRRFRDSCGPSGGLHGGFLPTMRADLRARGWDQLDILIVSGDAYVDHPAFGPVVIARVLESNGFKVGMVAQPAWHTLWDLERMGRPRLFVGVSAGNLDSMLNKLTAQKKVRSADPYSPGGRPDQRPNRATIVYSNLCRRAFPGLPIVIGGVEASLRRMAHYDYWSDQVRRSIVLDAKADLLVYGMGERPVLEIARALDEGTSVGQLTGIRGTAWVMNKGGCAPGREARREAPSLARDPLESATEPEPVVLPSFELVREDRMAFARMTRMALQETNPWNARPMVQAHGDQAVIINPPALPLQSEELDRIYELGYRRRPHPSYKDPIPAFEIIRSSVVASRGCFGGCAFCSLTAHEGRVVQSRTTASMRREVRAMTTLQGFAGVLSDVGGPTANMYGLGCSDPAAAQACRLPSCVHPSICKRLRVDHGPLIDLLRGLRREKGVRRVFIASGIRHDLALRSPEFIRELAGHHTGGQLSLAPEHADESVLRRMRKPDWSTYERFTALFEAESERAGKRQFAVPYFMVGHPGSGLKDTIDLALRLKVRGIRPRQVQEFVPTPMTEATAMYYCGVDPVTSKPVEVVRDLREKRILKALVLYWDEAQWRLAREGLRNAGRADLIGSGPGCLVPGESNERGHGVRRSRGRAVARSRG